MKHKYRQIICPGTSKVTQICRGMNNLVRLYKVCRVECWVYAVYERLPKFEATISS